MVPLGAAPGGVCDLAAANTAAALWCEQVNNVEHSQIAVPAQRSALVLGASSTISTEAASGPCMAAASSAPAPSAA